MKKLAPDKNGDRYQICISLPHRERFYKNIHAGSKLEAVLIEQEYRKILGKQINDVNSVASIAYPYLLYESYIYNVEKTLKAFFKLNVAQPMCR